jgi:hypothetical protein
MRSPRSPRVVIVLHEAVSRVADKGWVWVAPSPWESDRVKQDNDGPGKVAFRPPHRIPEVQGTDRAIERARG